MAYVPSRSHVETYQLIVQQLDSLATKYPDHQISLAGDFNIPNVGWSNEPLHWKENGYLCPELRLAASVIRNSVSLLGLHQIYELHPDKNYTLDLLLISPGLLSTYESADQLLASDKHHSPAFFKFNEAEPPSLQSGPSSAATNYYKADYARMNSTLLEIDWTEVLGRSNLNLDSSVDKF